MSGRVKRRKGKIQRQVDRQEQDADRWFRAEPDGRKVVDGAYARSKTKFPEDSRKRGVGEEGEGDKKMK